MQVNMEYRIHFNHLKNWRKSGHLTKFKILLSLLQKLMAFDNAFILIEIMTVESLGFNQKTMWKIVLYAGNSVEIFKGNLHLLCEYTAWFFLLMKSLLGFMKLGGYFSDLHVHGIQQ